MKGYKKYYGRKIMWYLITLVVAVILNFLLPRLMPGDPVAVIAAQVSEGMTDKNAAQQIYADYVAKFGLDKSLFEQFFIWLGNLFHGDLGVSFSMYPRQVTDVLASSVTWTVCLQFPAIIVGWLIGNLLGAIAAYKKGIIDKGIMPLFMFISSIPAFGIATILLFVFGIQFGIAPTSGGYGFDLIPSASFAFFKSILTHYQLPFWSIVLATVGGQAIGMRSMSIYELNADYVKYSRFLGIKNKKIIRYVFRNAMLPQVTGLALSIGTMVGGALVAEIIFSYPGLGYTLINAIKGQDYPLISACTLIITIMVLLANLLLEIVYGLIDPRIKTAQQD